MITPADMRKRGDELRRDFHPTGTPSAEADAINESRDGGQTDVNAIGVESALLLMARTVAELKKERTPWRVFLASGPLTPGLQTGILIMNRPRLLLYGVTNATANPVTVTLVDMDGSSTSEPFIFTIPPNGVLTFPGGVPFPSRLGCTALAGLAPFRLSFYGKTY